MTSPGVRVELGDRSYEVQVGAASVRGEWASSLRSLGVTRATILADENVAPHHGDAVREALEAVGIAADLEPLPSGESAKRLEIVEDQCRRFVRKGLERGDAIVGLGGGAATDVAGFVAAVVLRGVRYASLPTTLLGQVDAAIGGKTGVNLPEGKNLVGAFHQPSIVVCDTAFLRTLPEREFRAGMAEVVKTAWIGDPDLFEILERASPLTAESPLLPEVVRRCVEVKAGIVARDEREAGERAKLNFGHTIGHALETESNGRLLHGEAVALGMVAALRLSVETGRCEAALLDRLVGVLEGCGLPVRTNELDPDAVLDRTRHDKKRAGGRDRYLLTEGLGLVSVARDLPDGAPRAAIEFLRR